MQVMVSRPYVTPPFARQRAHINTRLPAVCGCPARRHPAAPCAHPLFPCPYLIPPPSEPLNSVAAQPSKGQRYAPESMF
jgi:hypothetical protein